MKISGEILNQILARTLYAWLRKQRKPHGKMNRRLGGVCLTYSGTYRRIHLYFTIMLLAFAPLILFDHKLMADQSRAMVWFMKTAWVAITLFAILTPFEVLLECVIVTPEKLVKRNLFGKLTHLPWRKIQAAEARIGGNELVLKGPGPAKIVINLAYDGLEDFERMAHEKLSPELSTKISAAIHRTERAPAKTLRPPQRLN